MIWSSSSSYMVRILVDTAALGHVRAHGEGSCALLRGCDGTQGRGSRGEVRLKKERSYSINRYNVVIVTSQWLKSAKNHPISIPPWRALC